MNSVSTFGMSLAELCSNLPHEWLSYARDDVPQLWLKFMGDSMCNEWWEQEREQEREQAREREHRAARAQRERKAKLARYIPQHPRWLKLTARSEGGREDIAARVRARCSYLTAKSFVCSGSAPNT
jgi:hypothetical protein